VVRELRANNVVERSENDEVGTFNATMVVVVVVVVVVVIVVVMPTSLVPIHCGLFIDKVLCGV
jgi:hypothetical protein